MEIWRSDGDILMSDNVRYAMGDPQAPLSAEQLWIKFEDCVAWSKLKLDAKTVFAQLQQLEKLATANALFSRRAK